MSSTEQEILDADNNAVTEAMRILRGTYETVQIFVQRTDCSHDASYGNGDSLYGQVKRWVIQQEAAMRLEIVEQDDEGEDE